MEIREIKIANESTYKKVTLTVQDDIFIFNNLTSEKAHAYEKRKYALRPFFKLPLRIIDCDTKNEEQRVKSKSILVFHAPYRENAGESFLEADSIESKCKYTFCFTSVADAKKCLKTLKDYHIRREKNSLKISSSGPPSTVRKISPTNSRSTRFTRSSSVTAIPNMNPNSIRHQSPVPENIEPPVARPRRCSLQVPSDIMKNNAYRIQQKSKLSTSFSHRPKSPREALNFDDISPIPSKSAAFLTPNPRILRPIPVNTNWKTSTRLHKLSVGSKSSEKENQFSVIEEEHETPDIMVSPRPEDPATILEEIDRLAHHAQGNQWSIDEFFQKYLEIRSV